MNLLPCSSCFSWFSDGSAAQFSTQFSEFIRYWRQLGPVDSRSENDSDEILYVKDWHFVREYPSSGLYQLPIVFGEDWINDWWDLQKEKQDDYRFVYMGPKESWTPLHADVFRSYSWSYNVCGAKKWILFPPSDEPFITNRFVLLPPYSISMTPTYYAYVLIVLFLF
jgi:hypothetical protein